MRKLWVKIVLAAVALVAAVVIAVPFFVNADTFRPQIENQLTSSLNRKVTLGHLSLSLLTGSLEANNISIADDPALSQSPFLEASQLGVGIKVGDLLFHHAVKITNLTIDSPSIHLIELANGTWNFSSMGTNAQASSQPGAPPALSVDELRIKNGSATMSTVPATGKPLSTSAVDLTVKQFSFTTAFPFELSLKLPADGSVQLKGTAGPIAQQDASKTPFQADLQVKHFDPVGTNVIPASDGIGMVADMDLKIASDGANLTSNGKITATKLKLMPGGSLVSQPVNIDYNVTSNLATLAGKVNDLAIHTGPVAAHIKGTYHPAGDSVAVDLHLSAPNLPIDQVEALLPAVGITLPSGSKLTGGTLTANLAITGPASALTIAGPVEIDNTKLAGFDLGSKLQGINPFKGTSDGTPIEKLSSDVKVTPQMNSFGNIYGSVPVIGTATGSGTISPTEELNFQMIAKLNSSNMVGSAVNTGMNTVASLLGDNSNSAAGKGIPMTITGTASNPSIHVQVGKMVKQSAGNLLNSTTGQKGADAVKKLKGLFGK